jgi:hypothetical protein
VLWEIIAHANRFGESLGFELFHLLPFRLMFLLGLSEERGVDEVQIYMIHTKFLQTGVESGGNIGDVRDDFGGYEELLTGYTGLRDGCAELGFGFVDFGAVEVVVA